MKKILPVSIILQFLFVKSVFSCCGAFQKRLFPIGIIDNRVVSISMKMYRTCDGEYGIGLGPTNTFNWDVSTSLVITKGDTIELLQKVDSSFRITECMCTSETRDSLSGYYEELLPYFKKAFKKAITLPGIELLKFKSITYLYPDKNPFIKWIGDSSFIFLKTKSIHFFPPLFSSDGPVQTLKIVREYTIGKRSVYVLTFENNWGPLMKAKYHSLPPKDLSIENSFFYEYVKWHGGDLDFIIRT